jgi:serine/threonine-protein kinase
MKHGTVPVQIAGIAELELLELLGIGGFGQVWKAVDPSSGKLYALKFIQNLIPGSIFVERVRLEAEVNIPSKYIVPALGLREWDASTYLILFEYYDGQPLTAALDTHRFTPAQKCEIFGQILSGVADAHRCNIIHRDLKPGNILVGKDGEVRLIDFGISKFRDKGLTICGDVIGTPQYIAPEVLLEGASIADARADIFALGHILYELEMGQHFWVRQGWKDLKNFIAYLSQTPRPTEAVDFSDFRPQCFPDGLPVLTQMLKIDPEQRYPTIAEVIADLLPAKPEPPAATVLRTPIPDVPTPSADFLYPLLIIESGSNKDACTLLDLADGETRVIGRLEIAGNNDSISRRHLEFSREAGQLFVRDLGSKNGTLLRGCQLTVAMGAVPIYAGDRLRVGDVFLRLEVNELEGRKER